MCERLAQANVPQVVVEAVRVGRMTALRKPDGGVRGIVAGDVIRRLVSRTIAKRHHTLPVLIVHTCWVRVHCPCFARLVRAEPAGNSDLHRWGERFDQISRAAMLDGLLNVESATLFFRLSACSMEPCGKTPVVWCTRSVKVRG